MNDIFAVMLDGLGLVPRESDIARTEARRIAAERERRAAANAQRLADQPRSPNWAQLLPVSAVAVGGAQRRVEQPMTLQSAIAKAAHMATVVGRLRLGPRPGGLLGTRLR